MKSITALRKNLAKKSVRVFLVLAFVPAWILFIFPVLIEKFQPGLPPQIGLAAWSVAMWAPGLAALITNRYVEGKKAADLGLNRLGKSKYYLAAWTIPIVLTLLTGLLTWLLGVSPWDREYTLVRESLSQIPDETPLSPGLLLGIQIAASLTLAPLFNTLFALGEELGWRGYLFPQLLPAGENTAILASGVIWGVWHVPVILQGHNYPENPLLGSLMMIVFTVLLSVFLSWLMVKTRSPWAPALAHGTLNAVASLPLLFLKNVNITLGGTLPSLVGWIPLGLAAGLFLWLRKKEQ